MKRTVALISLAAVLLVGAAPSVTVGDLAVAPYSEIRAGVDLGIVQVTGVEFEAVSPAAYVFTVKPTLGLSPWIILTDTRTGRSGAVMLWGIIEDPVALAYPELGVTVTVDGPEYTPGWWVASALDGRCVVLAWPMSVG